MSDGDATAVVTHYTYSYESGSGEWRKRESVHHDTLDEVERAIRSELANLPSHRRVWVIDSNGKVTRTGERKGRNGPGDLWVFTPVNPAADCTCHHTCADDPAERCSLSGGWHVHPGDPCPVHPDAPGDR